MVKLRLTRMGAKKRPYYRIVAIHSRNKRDGEVIELIGTYAPLEENMYNINKEVALKWLKTGAQPTDTVRSIFKKTGVLEEFRSLNKKETKKKAKKVVVKEEKKEVKETVVKKPATKKPAAKKATTKKTTTKKETK